MRINAFAIGYAAVMIALGLLEWLSSVTNRDFQTLQPPETTGACDGLPSTWEDDHFAAGVRVPGPNETKS